MVGLARNEVDDPRFLDGSPTIEGGSLILLNFESIVNEELAIDEKLGTPADRETELVRSGLLRGDVA